MGSVSPRFQGRNGLEVTYEALGANVLGGQMVVPQTGTTTTGQQGATPAGANAINCLGVAASDAIAAANQAAFVTGTSGYDAGYPVIDTSVPDATFAAYTDVIIPVTYAAGAVAYGAKLKCAAAGAVQAHVSGTDAPERCIGWCAEPGGAAGGAVFLARIMV